MNLLKSLLPIAAIAAGTYFGGGTGGATAKKLADTFLTAGGGKDKPAFGAAPVVKATKLGQMNLGSRGSQIPVQMNPIQQVMQSDPRLESALVSLLNNARNQQVIDMFSKHGNINFTAKGGKQQAIQQTGIQV
jgi:hypothetical protein